METKIEKVEKEIRELENIVVNDTEKNDKEMDRTIDLLEKKQREFSEEIVKKVWKDKLFILFMKLRFPKETDEGYIREWKSRFMTGNPIPYMDNETKKAYLSAITKLCILKAI